jgi:hypothetical protein
MADFKKLFDVKDIDEHTLGCVEYVLNSPAYIDVFEPYLRSIRDTLSQRLLDPSNDRKQTHPDDFLRGGIVAIDGLLQYFKQIIEETQFERIAASQENLTPAAQYTREQQRGRHVPVLGAAEPLDTEPALYDPAEDF